MRILAVMNYRKGRSGITNAIDELFKSLRNEGFTVDVVSTHGRLRDRRRNIFGIFNRVAGYDLVLAVGCAYYGFLPILIGVIAARLHRKRILVDFHEGFPQSFMDRCGRFIKMFLKDIPITVASEYLGDIFEQRRFNIFTIPYHFHTEHFYKREKPFIWNKKFLWVGSFCSMYGPEIALKACELALRQRDDLEFVFFGDGPLLEKMKTKYNARNITFRGHVPREQLLKEYQNFSVLLNTSLGDNFPVRLVEASFSELLVVSSRCGGTPRIYSENECLFFDRGDYKRLSEYILEISQNPAPYDSLRLAMHRKVLGFTWDKVRGKWLQLLTVESERS